MLDNVSFYYQQNIDRASIISFDVIETKHSGNTVTWKTTCKTDQGNMDGSGKVVYSGTSFDGKMTVTMPSATMKFTSEMSGRRIGKCD